MDVYHKSLCGLIITAACCLHNICVDMQDDFDADPYTPELDSEENSLAASRLGARKRDEPCNMLSLNVD